MSSECPRKVAIVLCLMPSIVRNTSFVRIAIQFIINPFLEFIVTQTIGQYFGSAQNGCEADLLVDNVILELLDDGHDVLPVVRCLAMG